VEIVGAEPATRRSLRELSPGLPAALDDWADIALCPEREGRFDHIDAMWKAFERAAASPVVDGSEVDELPTTPQVRQA